MRFDLTVLLKQPILIVLLFLTLRRFRISAQLKSLYGPKLGHDLPVVYNWFGRWEIFNTLEYQTSGGFKGW